MDLESPYFQNRTGNTSYEEEGMMFTLHPPRDPEKQEEFVRKQYGLYNPAYSPSEACSPAFVGADSPSNPRLMSHFMQPRLSTQDDEAKVE